MNRWQRLALALKIGALVVGPLAGYIGAIVAFGFGFLGSGPLFAFPVDTLLRGAVLGFISALLCAATAYRPWPSALLTGGIMFMTAGVSFFIEDSMGWVAPIQHRAAIGNLVTSTMSLAAMGYLTAAFTKVWEKRRPNPAAAPESSYETASGQHRYRL
jgi:hypothetical protein